MNKILGNNHDRVARPFLTSSKRVTPACEFKWCQRRWRMKQFPQVVLLYSLI